MDTIKSYLETIFATGCHSHACKRRNVKYIAKNADNYAYKCNKIYN